MDKPLIVESMKGDPDRQITDAIRRERNRLRNFIRKHVPDPGDADDILQDVFYEFIEAYRLLKPIEQAGAWLFRVARNRITDRFRKQRIRSFDLPVRDPIDDIRMEDLLPSPDAGPEAAYARKVLVEELEYALRELPPEQRDVFIAHEIEGVSFKELAEQSGVSVNTLLSRKRYAVLHLRRRLQAIYEEFQKG